MATDGTNVADEAAIIDEVGTREQVWLMLVGLTFSVLYTSRMLYAHVEPHVWYDRIDGWVLGLCFAAYMIAWVPFWLYPFDLAGIEARGDLHKRCSELPLSYLQFFWQIVYVANLVTAYLTYDFARSYLDAGGFTIRRNAWLAWLTVRDWYSTAALVCAVPIALIAYLSGQAFDWGLCAAAAAHTPHPANLPAAELPAALARSAPARAPQPAS